MSKRDGSSLILQSLKKRELPALGRPVVPVAEAEARLGGGLPDSYPDSALASQPAIYPDSRPARPTKLLPRKRTARSSLLIRLDPELHRRLEEVARFNGLTMNDIVVEAIDLHLSDFPQP